MCERLDWKRAKVHAALLPAFSRATAPVAPTAKNKNKKSPNPANLAFSSLHDVATICLPGRRIVALATLHGAYPRAIPIPFLFGRLVVHEWM